jgi:hypothetical protein
MSSVEAVNASGPVQLNEYGSEPSTTVISIAPIEEPHSELV